MLQNSFLKALVLATIVALILGNEIISLLVMVAWSIKGICWLFLKMEEGGLLK